MLEWHVPLANGVLRGARTAAEWAKDPKAQSASTRHLGGSNLGFLDGHAAWLPAQRILNMGRDGDLTGLVLWNNGEFTYEGYRALYGEPEPGMVFIW